MQAFTLLRQYETEFNHIGDGATMMFLRGLDLRLLPNIAPPERNLLGLSGFNCWRAL
jgi:hypothetical protein